MANLCYIVPLVPNLVMVTTYRGLPDGNLAVLQAYIDADDAQSFYTLSWASDLAGTPLLVAAGSNRVIRVINCATGKLFKSLIGHGGSINEIRTQPLKPSLFISASKDESVRLWNVHTGICILIFAGTGGHRHDVLSVDFHPSDMHQIASCGIDNTVKIWSMKEFRPYVQKSFTWTDLPSKFPTKVVQFPLMTCVVHSNYVNCTRWLGDFILSKSVENEIVLWEPKTKEQGHGEGSIDVLQKYPVPDCDIWCIKFSCDFHFNQLAIGNREGKIYVWDVQTCPPELITMLSSPQCKMTIRQTAVSFDGSQWYWYPSALLSREAGVYELIMFWWRGSGGSCCVLQGAGAGGDQFRGVGPSRTLQRHGPQLAWAAGGFLYHGPRLVEGAVQRRWCDSLHSFTRNTPALPRVCFGVERSGLSPLPSGGAVVRVEDGGLVVDVGRRPWWWLPQCLWAEPMARMLASYHGHEGGVVADD
uniref:Uncharacterized protein n=1 Tax=Aegilops tauschii TaxID=37682 RepID=M8BA65_AEGTA